MDRATTILRSVRANYLRLAIFFFFASGPGAAPADVAAAGATGGKSVRTSLTVSFSIFVSAEEPIGAGVMR